MFFNKKSFPILLGMFLICINALSQIYNTKVEAEIKVEIVDELIKITGMAYNKTQISQSLRYVLSVIRTNPRNTNQSKNDQKGRFVISSGQKTNLSITSINANTNDRVIILLLIYNLDDELIGKDRIVFHESTNKVRKVKNNSSKQDAKNQNAQSNDGVILKGVVVEDTKTKPGRDFYKMFYSLYSSNNINGKKIVTVKEVLAIGTNTKIKIIIDNQSIFEFFVRPRNEYLKQMSEQAIRRVYKYFIRLNLDSEKAKQY